MTKEDIEEAVYLYSNIKFYNSSKLSKFRLVNTRDKQIVYFKNEYMGTPYKFRICAINNYLYVKTNDGVIVDSKCLKNSNTILSILYLINRMDQYMIESHKFNGIPLTCG